MTREQMLKRIKELGGLTRPNCLKVVIEKYREMIDDKNMFDLLVKYYTYKLYPPGTYRHALSCDKCALCKLYEHIDVIGVRTYDCKTCGLLCEEDGSIYKKVRIAISTINRKDFESTCQEMIEKCQELLRECEKE